MFCKGKQNKTKSKENDWKSYDLMDLCKKKWLFDDKKGGNSSVIWQESVEQQ